MAARGRGRLPRLGHGQGRRRRRPHRADRGPGHVRRRFSAEGRGARRERGARLRRRGVRPPGCDSGRARAAAAAALADREQAAATQRAAAGQPPLCAGRPAAPHVDQAPGTADAAALSAPQPISARPPSQSARAAAGSCGSAAGAVDRRSTPPRRASAATAAAAARPRSASHAPPAPIETTTTSCRPTRGPAHAPIAAIAAAARRGLAAARAARAIRQSRPTPVEVKPTATLACPIVSALDTGSPNAVQPAAQQVVRPAGGRDQADLGLFLPRHERPARRAHLRACLRQRARHRGLRAGRRPPHHREGRLARLAGGAGLPARRAGRGLRSVHHGAGAGLEPLPLRPHPRRPDAARQRPAHLQPGRGRRRGGRGAGARRTRAMAARPIEPPPTRRYDPPVESGNDPFAWRGDARRGDPTTTGSIAARRPGVKDPAAEDLDWVEEPGPRPAIDWSATATRCVSAARACSRR